jgi:hypothetical protein
MKKTILLIGLIFISSIVYSTAFNNSEIEINEFYLYKGDNEDPLNPVHATVFFKGNEIIFYAELNKSAYYSFKLLEAESRNLILQIPSGTMSSKKQIIEETLGILETGEYTLRAEIYENTPETKTIKEINFTVLQEKIEITVPEINPLLILGLLIGIITIIHKD